MSLSAKARQAKRRANLKKDPEAYHKYLEQDWQRKAAKRLANKNLRSPAEQQEFLLKEKVRIREHRANKKLLDQASQQHLLSFHISNGQTYEESSHSLWMISRCANLFHLQ